VRKVGLSVMRTYILFFIFFTLTAFIFSGLSYSKGMPNVPNQNNLEKFEDNHGQKIKEINIQKNQEKKEIQNEFKNEIQEKNEIKNNSGSETDTTNAENEANQLKQEKQEVNKYYTEELKANGKENK